MSRRTYSVGFALLCLLLSQMSTVYVFAQDDDFILFIPAFLAKMNYHRPVSYVAVGNENSFVIKTSHDNSSYIQYSPLFGEVGAHVLSSQHGEKGSCRLTDEDFEMDFGDMIITKSKDEPYFWVWDNLGGSSYKVSINEENVVKMSDAGVVNAGPLSDFSPNQVYDNRPSRSSVSDQQAVGEVAGQITLSSYCPEKYDKGDVTVYDHGIFGNIYNTKIVKINDSEFIFSLNIDPVDEFEQNPGLYCRKLNQQLYSVCMSGMLAGVVDGGNSISKVPAHLLRVLNSHGLMKTPERIGVYYDLWSSALLASTTVSGELFSDCDQFLENIIQCEEPKLVSPRVNIDLYRGYGKKPPVVDEALTQVADNKFSMATSIDRRPYEGAFNMTDFSYMENFLRVPREFTNEVISEIYIDGECGNYCIGFNNAILKEKCFDLQRVGKGRYAFNLTPIHNEYVKAMPFPDATSGFFVKHKESGNVVERTFSTSLIGGELVAQKWYFVRPSCKDCPFMVMLNEEEIVNDASDTFTYLKDRYDDLYISARIHSCQTLYFGGGEPIWVDRDGEYCAAVEKKSLYPVEVDDEVYMDVCGDQLYCHGNNRITFQLFIRFGNEEFPISSVARWNYD